jgi:MYXO-CTERM domain-containing protein
MLGLPNIGNGGFNGAYAQISQGQPWAEWSNLLTSAWGGGPGSGSSQELDLDVPASTILKANWNAADKGIRASESIGEAKLKDSLYRGCKPSWYGDLTWPAFDPNNPNQSYDAIPAGYRFVHKAAVPGATTDPDPCAPGAPIDPPSGSASSTGGGAAGDDGACGCRTVQATESRWPFAAAALIGFGAALRRRQRRRGARTTSLPIRA